MNPLSYAELIEPNVDACDESDDTAIASAANDTEFPDECVHCHAPPTVDCDCYAHCKSEAIEAHHVGVRGRS